MGKTRDRVKQMCRDKQAAAATPQPAVPEKKDGGLLRSVPAESRWQAMKDTGRTRLSTFWFGNPPEPVPSHLGLVEPTQDGKIGICCSGGGIRSAAFNLGALQCLQEAEELEKASYLAAVSGGSYIAAAFTMMAKTWSSKDRPATPAESGYDDSDPHALDVMKPFEKGSPEEQYLRNRSSYMAPDGAAVIFVVFRALLGLAFNLVFLSLPIFAVAMLLGEFAYRPHLSHLVGRCGENCRDSIGWWWFVPVGIFALGAALALFGMLRRTRDREGRFLAVWSVRLLFIAALFAFLVVATPALVDVIRVDQRGIASASGAPHKTGVAYGTVGLASLILGVLGQLREGFSTPKKAYEELEKGQKWFRSLSSRARLAVAYLAGGLLGPALLAAVYVFGVSIALANSPHGVRSWVVLVGICSAAAFTILYLFADLTSWSLHPFYKRRVCTAFALKHITAADLKPAERGRLEALPNGAEGTDGTAGPGDVGIAMERDYELLVRLSETVVTDRPWPTLLVCAAANVSDTGATPPGRRVTSFTFSPYAVGGPLVGAVNTGELEGAFDGPDIDQLGKLRKMANTLRRATPGLRDERRRRVSDFSLPAAVAMSGAAISPSMGKLTRRPFTFLLALANMRLGVWVPNPRWVKDVEKRQLALFGRPRPSYLFRELLGINHVRAKYLYVTDGGHYENLGLVELLRRGCRQIYCFDASGGEGFEVLGDAIALARSELAIDINIQPHELFPDKTTGEAKSTAMSVDFNYPGDAVDAKPCRLVYARNVMTAQSPWDVKAYHQKDPSFPHNSTADQLYTDQKFEGYRVLGERAGQAAVTLMAAAS